MACTAQQGTADTCITSDAACADCPLFSEGGMEGFMDAIDGAFSKTQAFVMPTDPSYCDVAQDNINQEITANYGCCCQTELTDYVKCNFDQELTVSFGLVGCEFGGGAEEEEGEAEEEGFPMMIVIIAVVSFVVLCLCCCCIGYCCYRRRRNQNNVEVKVDIKSETKHDTSTIEDKKATTTTMEPSSDWSAGGDAEMGNGAVPPNCAPNAGMGFGMDRNSNAFFQNQSMMQHHSKMIPSMMMDRGYGDDDQSEAYFRNQGELPRRSSHRDLGFDDESQRSRGRRLHRSRSCSASGRRRSVKRGSSKKSLYDDESNDSSTASSSYDDEWGEGSGKSKKHKHKKKNKRKKDHWEKSMRQARSIINDAKNMDGSDTVAQATMSAEMVNLVADLKKQKEDMENKLKQMEDEKSALLLQMDRNQREAEKKVVNAELDAVKREKEEMAKMIEELETTKSAMEGKLLSAKEETERVKEQHHDTICQVQAMIAERQHLQAKLSSVEMSRDDIHKRLMEAESLSKKLKEEKDVKKKEITALLDSGNTPMLEETQRQRRTISKNLKRLEEEKVQFRSMLAQMDVVPEEQIDLSPRSNGRRNGSSASVRSINNSNHGGCGSDHGSEPDRRLSIGRSNSSYFPHRNIDRGIQRQSSADNMIGAQDANGIDAMLRGLEKDMMYTHAPQQGFIGKAMELSESDLERPAGWLGNTITKRSYTDLTELDSISRRSHRSGTDRRSRSRSKHRHRGESRSSHGRRSKSREDSSSHSRLERKREKLRQKEQDFRDEMKRSRSTRSTTTRRSMDCDGSFQSLDSGEIY